MQSREKAVRQWLASLGVLVAGTSSRQEAEARLAAYAPLLIREFPPQAFTADSLTAVARACKFFPSFGELCTHLGDWWKANRPTVRALPPPDLPPKREPPTEAEMAAVRAQVEACLAAIAPSAQPPPPAPKQLCLSDEALLAAYERLAAQGNTAALSRVGILRDRLRQREPVHAE